MVYSMTEEGIENKTRQEKARLKTPDSDMLCIFSCFPLIHPFACDRPTQLIQPHIKVSEKKSTETELSNLVKAAWRVMLHKNVTQKKPGCYRYILVSHNLFWR